MVSPQTQEMAVAYPGFTARITRLRASDEVWNRVAGVLLAVSCLAYFYAAILVSIRSPLWMDEVMAKWTSQLPANRIMDALLHGNMTSPPAYFYLLKGVTFFFGSSNLALRLPSIVAVFVASVVAFILTRRRLSTPFAALAMVLALETGLFEYATDVREYALVTACFAWAVLIWDNRSLKGAISKARVAAITFLLIACVALHFYGVLLVADFALMELIWAGVNRRIRMGLWAGIFAAGCSVFIWYPLMRQITKVVGFYSAASGYFGRPTLPKLLTAYWDLAFGGKGSTLLTCALTLVAAGFLYSNISGTDFVANHAQDRRLRRARESVILAIIIFALICIPAIVFAFAFIVTKTFSARYAIAASLGFAILIAILFSYLQAGAFLTSVLLLASVFLFVLIPTHISRDHYGIASWSTIGGNEPIVVGEGLAFLELQEASPPALRQRLVFLTWPSREFNPDPTNDDLVKRWKLFRPELNVESRDTFLRNKPQFLLLHSDQSTDVITPFLMQSGQLKAIRNIKDERDDRGIWIFENLPSQDQHAD